MDDSSARRILIIEDEDDLDLDKLLLCDTSARESFASTTGHISPPPSPKSLSPSSLSSSIKNHASVSSAASVAAMPPTGHHSSLLKTTTTCPPIILASEEGEDSVGRWILPAPALPGDYLNGSLHRVPSKSILKKTSSYGNFDSVLSSSRGGGSSTTPGRTRRPSIAMDSSSTSQASHSRGRYNNRSQVSDEPPSSSSPGEASPKNNISKKTSFLSFASLESNTSQSQQQNQHGGNSIGWDLDADDALSASSPLRNIIPLAEDESLSSIPSSRHVGDAAGAGGGGASSESRNSDSSTRIRRNVSFHAVDVREYDRTVGDHPGCRSGPPVRYDHNCLLYLSDF